jgi:hypothetical protein
MLYKGLKILFWDCSTYTGNLLKIYVILSLVEETSPIYVLLCRYNADFVAATSPG